MNVTLYLMNGRPRETLRFETPAERLDARVASINRNHRVPGMLKRETGQLRTPISLSIRRPNGELLNQSLVSFEWRKFLEAMHGASGCPWQHFTRITFDKRRAPRRIVKHRGTEIHKLHAIDSSEDPTHTARTKVVPRMPVQTSDNRLPVCDKKCGAGYRSAE